MPLATEYNRNKLFKIVLVGNSGAGKTGALASLVPHFDLRIVDFDDNLEMLFNAVKKTCPERLDSIQYQTFRDRYKMGPTGPYIAGTPKALPNALKALEKWEDGTNPAEWGPKKVLVLDSLTHMGRASLAWAKGVKPGLQDQRLYYKPAQDVIADTLGGVTSQEFNCNVIVISHIDIREGKDGSVKGWIRSIGEALGPDIPTFFSTVILSETSGSGASVKRTLKTLPTALMDLKNPVNLPPALPMETGLIDIVRQLQKGAD